MTELESGCGKTKKSSQVQLTSHASCSSAIAFCQQGSLAIGENEERKETI